MHDAKTLAVRDAAFRIIGRYFNAHAVSIEITIGCIAFRYSSLAKITSFAVSRRRQHSCIAAETWKHITTRLGKVDDSTW